MFYKNNLLILMKEIKIKFCKKKDLNLKVQLLKIILDLTITICLFLLVEIILIILNRKIITLKNLGLYPYLFLKKFFGQYLY
jgi:hypothetical protein